MPTPQSDHSMIARIRSRTPWLATVRRVVPAVRAVVGLAALVGTGACGERPYTWAFAQNLDGSFHPSETCRESLAQSLYAPANQAHTTRQGNANLFLFTGVMESYRIYGYHSQAECEVALNGLVARQRK